MPDLLSSASTGVTCGLHHEHTLPNCLHACTIATTTLIRLSAWLAFASLASPTHHPSLVVQHLRASLHTLLKGKGKVHRTRLELTPLPCLSGIASSEKVLQDVFKTSMTSTISSSSEPSELIEDVFLTETTLMGLFGSRTFASVSSLVVELSFGGIGEYFVGAAW